MGVPERVPEGFGDMLGRFLETCLEGFGDMFGRFLGYVWAILGRFVDMFERFGGHVCEVWYAKQIIVVNIILFLENFGAEQLGSIAYKTGSNRSRKVEET